MSWLLDLVRLAQTNTWVMLLVLWLTVVAGGKVIHGNISDIDEDVGELASTQDALQEDVHTIDLKQDHIVERQEMVMESVGVNEQEIRDLRERQAHLSAQHDDDGFFRGNTGTSGDD